MRRRKLILFFLVVLFFSVLIIPDSAHSAEVNNRPKIKDRKKQKENNDNIPQEEQVKEKIILLDPGHGGYDGGAISKNGTVEKDINLSISLKLRTQLEKQGFKVHMTREKDESLNTLKPSSKKVEDLTNRCKKKREVQCDMFISIHQNTFPKGAVKGAQVWYSNFEESKYLAHSIQTSLRENVDTSNKRIEKPALDSYRILRDGYEAPSVLVECGFITNYDEEQKLKSDSYQEKLAEAIVIGVKNYYEEYDKRNMPPE